jgi:UDP-N-acetylmuramate--alanine ligase
MFSSIKKIHFVGIGGIGMSGIAEILLDQDFEISGSDQVKSAITDHLEKLGAKIHEGHTAKNLPKDADILVYSSAVPLDNPEIKEAEKREIPVVRRAEMLAEVMRLKYGIGVAGTHGKTTTTSMISLVLTEGELDPTTIVGGKLSSLGGTNARLGRGDFIVVEADEYDRTFLSLTPTIAVLTTLEIDHLDCYKNLREIKNAFIQFANKVPFYGFVVLCLDEPVLRNIKPDLQKKKVVTYGLNAGTELRAIKIKQVKNVSRFIVTRDKRNLGNITLQIPGDHNIKNALAAIAVGLELGISFSKIKKGIEKFTGVYRRWEKKGEARGITVYDDYAHHPTECRASLAGVKSGWDNRVVCVFQPHLYSRTRDFYQGFAKALNLADVIVITDVYPAREKPIKGVTGEMIVKEVKKLGRKEVYYVQNKTKISSFLKKITEPNDIVITMGAGDIWKSGEEFLALLKKEPGFSKG